MARRSRKNLFLYKHRYAIGYLAYAVLLVVTLAFVALLSPGLSRADMMSAGRSIGSIAGLGVDAPYVALQQLSIHVFGLHEWSIRLPSMIIAGMTGLTFLALLKLWLKQGVGLLGSLTAATSTGFLSGALAGSPLIMLLFWPVALLYVGTRIIRNSRGQIFWKAIFLILFGLSLFTPTMAYFALIVFVLGIIQPHVRYSLKRLRPLKLSGVIIAFILSLIPAGFSIMNGTLKVSTLLGLPKQFPDAETLLGNARQVFGALANFYDPHVTAYFVVPLFSFSTIGLILLGIYRLAKDNFSARTVFLGLWSLLLLLVALLTPELTIALWLPLMITAVIGIGELIDIWGHLFPVNPYARFAALVPISILVIAIIGTNISRFELATRYSAQSATVFSSDLSQLRKYLDSHKGSATLTVSELEEPFYMHLTKEYKDLRIGSASNGVRIYSASVDLPGGNKSAVISDSSASAGARFSIYTR